MNPYLLFANSLGKSLVDSRETFQKFEDCQHALIRSLSQQAVTSAACMCDFLFTLSEGVPVNMKNSLESTGRRNSTMMMTHATAHYHAWHDQKFFFPGAKEIVKVTVTYAHTSRAQWIRQNQP